jgi:uncharacterized protein
MDDGFEWDESKRLANIRDHGVDFREAAQIFRNPVIEARDAREDYGEERLRALGHVQGRYYLVAYTWRGRRRRIIGAWKTGEDGKQRYEAILSR